MVPGTQGVPVNLELGPLGAAVSGRPASVPSGHQHRVTRASSTRLTGVVRGAAIADAAPSFAILEQCLRQSRDGLGALGLVGSIISASCTTNGKYTVGAWKPFSKRRLPTSTARSGSGSPPSWPPP